MAESKKTVELTFDEEQALALILPGEISKMKKYVGTWREKAKEKNPDETPKYIHAEGNAEYLEKQLAALESLSNKLGISIESR